MTDFKTLQEAQEYLQKNIEHGVICPCCSQYVKIYERSITSSMAQALILIYKYFRAHQTEKWLHVQDYLKKLDIPAPVMSGDVSKLKFWGILLPQDGTRDDGSKRIGFYSITQKGREFVEGRITVPEKARIYNQRFLGFAGREVSIREILNEGFNYADLMGEYFVSINEIEAQKKRGQLSQSGLF